MYVNVVVIAGNLTKDPELRYVPSGTAVANFNLALNRVWKAKDGEKKEDVAFIKVVAWGKLAELCGEYLTKGRAAIVEGRLKQEKWQGEDGKPRERTCVVAERVQFIRSQQDARSTGAAEAGVGSVAGSEDIPF